MSYHVFKDPDIGDTTKIQLPVTLKVDLDEARRELKIPDFVSVDNFAMKKTLAIFWVTKNLDELRGEIDDTTQFPVSLFGGVAFRFLCPRMNNPNNPLYRIPNDVDYAVLKEDGPRFSSALQLLGSKFGSGLSHWTFRRDRVFNGFRRGTRYRLRCVTGIDANGAPLMGLTDIVCDTLSFCHEIPLRDAIKSTTGNVYTIGLERLILSKTQFIKRVPREQVTEDVKPRFLENFGDTDALLGMEPKDMRDVTAAFLDHEPGTSTDHINLDIIGKLLQTNWGLRRTVLLNLTNLTRVLSTDFLGLNKDELELATARIERVIEMIKEKYVAKRPRFSFSSEWWESVDEGRA